MTETLAPTQLVYDRIQRAATKSPSNFIEERVTIKHELCPEGIRTRGLKNTGTGLVTEHITTFREIATAEIDPLWYAFAKVANELGLDIKVPDLEERARNAGM